MAIQKNFSPLEFFCLNSSLFYRSFLAVIRAYIKQGNKIRINSIFVTLLLFPFFPFSPISPQNSSFFPILSKNSSQEPEGHAKIFMTFYLIIGLFHYLIISQKASQMVLKSSIKLKWGRTPLAPPPTPLN